MDHVARLRRPKSNPTALSAVEVNAVRAAIAYWEQGQSSSGPRPDGQLGQMVEVMLGTSARIGEVLAIRRRDVDVTSATATVRIAGVSAAMSLRYAHLFDATVRAEYERALDLAKGQIGHMPTLDRPGLPILGSTGGCGDHEDWRDAPAIKARLAGGYCVRAPAQGACPYANICEHSPSFHTDAASISVLSAQRLDTQALAADAQARGWIAEADRHQQLLDRLDTLIAQATA